MKKEKKTPGFIYAKCHNESDTYGRVEFFQEKQNFLYEIYGSCIIKQFGSKAMFKAMSTTTHCMDGIHGVAIPGVKPKGMRYVSTIEGLRLYKPDTRTKKGKQIKKEWDLLPKLPIEAIYDVLKPMDKSQPLFSLIVGKVENEALFKIPIDKFYIPEDLEILTAGEYLKLAYG